MKTSSRSAVAAFTIAAIALAPTVARADRVVLYPLTGRVDADRLEELEDRVADVIREVGHEVIAPPGGVADTSRPETSAQMGGVATASGATYVVLAEMEPMRGQYRLHVRVGYQPTQRVEEIVVTVLEQEEHDRLLDVMRSMLRPAGLGEDAVRLTGGEDVPPPPVDDAERLRREEEERARLAAEEEARRQREAEEAARTEEERRRAEEAAAREAEERARREQEAWNTRATYGSDGEWIVMIGGAASYAHLFTPGPVIRDGMLVGMSQDRGFGLIQARLGHAFAGTDGLELRGGLDVFLGSAGGMMIVVGGVWQFTPFVGVPIHFGPTLELGASIAFTGAQNAGFVVRAGAVASWTPIPHLQIELAVPELGVMTNGSGMLLVGAALRAGYRF